MYHAAAMYMSMMMIHYWDTPAVLGIGDRPLSSHTVLEVLKYSGADAVTLPPAIFEELSQSDEAIGALKGLTWAGFGGGKRPASGLTCSSRLTWRKETSGEKQAID
jgi:hypothetical protein